MIWAPFHDQRDMNLMNETGIKNFEQWIKATKPTHVVIDTIRSAFPGLQENSAEQWGYINQLCLKLRNELGGLVAASQQQTVRGFGVGQKEAQPTTVLEQIKITWSIGIRRLLKLRQASTKVIFLLVRFLIYLLLLKRKAAV